MITFGNPYTVEHMMQPETLMRALADNTRLRIVNLLLAKGELCVCELVSAMEMAQPKVSRHLAILREAGVVVDRREGLWIHYRIHPGLPAWATRLLEALREGCRKDDSCRRDLKRLPSVRLQKRKSCRT